MMERNNKHISVRRQCDLLGVHRSRLYYSSGTMNPENLRIMNRIDAEFTAHPFTGIDRMVEFLRCAYGLHVNPKRVRRLMRKMGLMALYPKPRTSFPAMVYMKYPCLLKTLSIDAPDMVWCSDITYIRLRGGFMYLVAILDYFSRYVLSWSVSNSLESLFCLDALDEALSNAGGGVLRGARFALLRFGCASAPQSERIRRTVTAYTKYRWKFGLDNGEGLKEKENFINLISENPFLFPLPKKSILFSFRMDMALINANGTVLSRSDLGKTLQNAPDANGSEWYIGVVDEFWIFRQFFKLVLWF
jgi:hypothetical protein